MDAHTDDWLTIGEAARYVRVPTETIRSQVADGRLRAYRIGEHVRFRRTEIDDLLLGHPIDPAQLDAYLGNVGDDDPDALARLVLETVGVRVASHHQFPELRWWHRGPSELACDTDCGTALEIFEGSDDEGSTWVAVVCPACRTLSSIDEYDTATANIVMRALGHAPHEAADQSAPVATKAPKPAGAKPKPPRAPRPRKSQSVWTISAGAFESNRRRH